MFAVPVAIPVTNPESRTTVALAVLLLIQVPPAVALDKSAVDPTQTLLGPVLAAGAAITVTSVVLIQPVGNVYVIVVVPNDAGVTTPPEEMVATPVVPLLHVPPAGDDDKPVVPAGQSNILPVMVSGMLFTVTANTDLQPVAKV
jgi:hypothetical protein